MALIAATAITLLSQKGFLEHFESLSLDLSFQMRGAIRHNPKITIIEISDYDIANIGRWPWARSWHAAIARALTTMGARSIYFDIIFPEPSNDADDALFGVAIKSSGKVYIPFAFQPPSRDIDDAYMPIEALASVIKGTGAINIYPDSDGKMRRVPLVFPSRDEIYPHAILQLAADDLGLKIKEVTPDSIILSRDGLSLAIPTGRDNQLLVNWVGRWEKTFRHYSFFDVIAAYQAILENKKPEINMDGLKGSICLIGMTATGLYDIKPIPIQPEYPGIGIFATALSNIIDNTFMREANPRINLAILYIISLMPALLVFSGRPLRAAVAALLVASIYFMINFAFFIRGMRLELFTPLLGLLSSYATVSLYNFIETTMERQNFFKMSVTDGLTSLFNIRYFKMLIETEIMVVKADPDKKFCIAMTDADHFKKFNDTYGHQVGDLVLKSIASTLKTSVRGMDIVARYGGEEMIVLLRGSALKDGLNVAEKMRRNIESCIVKNDAGSYKVTVSFGVSRYKNGDTVDTLIKRADDALYKAKESGRNRVETIEVG